MSYLNKFVVVSNWENALRVSIKQLPIGEYFPFMEGKFSPRGPRFTN